MDPSAEKTATENQDRDYITVYLNKTAAESAGVHDRSCE